MVNLLRIKRHRSAQSSIEFFIIVGIGLAIFLPVVAVFYSQAINFQEVMAAHQAERAVNAITTAADEVYYMGPPALKTVKVYLPAQVKYLTINGNSVSLVLESRFGDYEVVSWSSANLTGYFKPTPGVKVLKLQSLGNVVNISQV